MFERRSVLLLLALHAAAGSVVQLCRTPGTPLTPPSPPCHPCRSLTALFAVCGRSASRRSRARSKSSRGDTELAKNLSTSEGRYERYQSGDTPTPKDDKVGGARGGLSWWRCRLGEQGRLLVSVPTEAGLCHTLLPSRAA